MALEEQKNPGLVGVVKERFCGSKRKLLIRVYVDDEPLLSISKFFVFHL